MDYNLRDVDEYINTNTYSALNIASDILGKPISHQSFNGIIGGKNGTYEVNPLNFCNADEYYEEWIKSHNQLFDKEKYCNHEKSVHRVHKLLQDTLLNQYIKMYLVRTWLRKHHDSI